ncbi:MAG: hypothetical protein H6945_15765 [Zoogloeaceae bacterium]|nr:hypothetical protein [Rhodocyclaceae bacterium]MCP5237194.1 hypothetical protein [Zoogloeaceae bacterium]
MRHWSILLVVASLTASAAEFEHGESTGNPERPLAESSLPTGAWSLEHEDLGGGRHRLHLHLDRLHTGDDGSARLIVHRWAKQQLRAEGRAGYELLHYEEGVRSGWFVGRRYVDAELRFFSSSSFGGF